MGIEDFSGADSLEEEGDGSNQFEKAELRRAKVLAMLRARERGDFDLPPENSANRKPLRPEDILDIKTAAHLLEKVGEVNLDLLVNGIDWQIGSRFDAHGIRKVSVTGQLDSLLNLLENGVNSSRRFDTAPLEVDPDLRAGLGAGLGTGGGAAYKDGSFVVLGPVDSSIAEGGIKYVIVNDVYYGAVARLKTAFPEVEFLRADEANQRLTEIVEKADKSVG